MRQIHWIISGALDRAGVWKWIAVNPAEHADKPALPHPDPEPPTAEEARPLGQRAQPVQLRDQLLPVPAAGLRTPHQLPDLVFLVLRLHGRDRALLFELREFR